jgi:hypothetical protein
VQVRELCVQVAPCTPPLTRCILALRVACCAAAMEAQIAHFGQTPAQLFSAPHPPRLPISQCTLPLFHDGLLPTLKHAQSPMGARLVGEDSSMVFSPALPTHVNHDLETAPTRRSSDSDSDGDDGRAVAVDTGGDGSGPVAPVFGSHLRPYPSRSSFCSEPIAESDNESEDDDGDVGDGDGDGNGDGDAANLAGGGGGDSERDGGNTGGVSLAMNDFLGTPRGGGDTAGSSTPKPFGSLSVDVTREGATDGAPGSARRSAVKKGPFDFMPVLTTYLVPTVAKPPSPTLFVQYLMDHLVCPLCGCDAVRLSGVIVVAAWFLLLDWLCRSLSTKTARSRRTSSTRHPRARFRSP